MQDTKLLLWQRWGQIILCILRKKQIWAQSLKYSGDITNPLKTIVYLTQTVKKVYRIHWCIVLIEIIKKSQSTYFQTPASHETWVMFVLSVQQILCVVPTLVNTTFSFSSLLQNIIHRFWIYERLWVPQSHNRGSYRPADWASKYYPLSAEGQFQVRSDSEAVPHHARTTCVDANQEAHFSKVLVNH